MGDIDLKSYSAIVAISLSIGFLAGQLFSRRGKAAASEDTFGLDDECKMVLVVRTDLKMGSGKIAAQCSHATLACYKAMQNSHPRLLKQWERTGQTKVALKCSSEDELLSLQKEARFLNLCAQSIRDAGRTQIAAGSRTVLGIIGPAKLVNQVTGKLRLL
ncbi:peptidyl-tRNA hydrolase 2 [Coprinopsis cinerea AmutBmut pab1-1]|nr:peptidyl-tRNA hydrolase 2 [Coprinopsis cinerea AmutBmut pab1-1]